MDGARDIGRPPRNVALVVPAHDEVARVGPFVERVEAALSPFLIDWHAEVIDDSDDEAVRSGLARADAEIVCVIDADLQHPPEILPELLAPIVLGRADICIGSRYRPGVPAIGRDNRWRRLAARALGILVRWLFPATRLTTDPGSGLFAVRREVLDSVTLQPHGPLVLAEILVQGQWRTVCDVPYRPEPNGGAHLGAGAVFELASELISLLRREPRLAASSERRNGHRGPDGTPGRRRVAPAQVELLRSPPSTDGNSGRLDRSPEVA